MESVGATWPHSLRCLRKGGTMVVSGGTGDLFPADLPRIFYNNLRIQGSTMGTRGLERLVALLVKTGVRPRSSALPLDRAAEGFAKLVDGKVVLTP